MRKKGQIPAQVFTYLISIFVVVIILVIGYKYIIVNKESISKAELISFKNKLMSDVKIIGIDYGSVRKVSYAVEDIGNVCLIDLSKKEQILESEIISNYPIMKDSIKSGLNHNTFLFSKSFLYSYYAGEIEIDIYPYVKCFKADNGKISFLLKGKGNKALILSESSAEISFEEKTKAEKIIDTVDQGINEINSIEKDLSFDEIEDMESVLNDIENI